MGPSAPPPSPISPHHLLTQPLDSAQPREIFISFAINSPSPRGCHQVPEPKVKRSLGGRAHPPAPSRPPAAPQPRALPHPGASADAQMPVRNLLLPDRGGQGHGGLWGRRGCYRRG